MARVGLVLVAVALTSSWPVLVAARVAATDEARGPVDPARVLRDRIVADFGLSGHAAIIPTDRSVADVRRLIGERVDRRLLRGATGVFGRDYGFDGEYGETLQVGLWSIRFPTSALARTRAQGISGKRYLSGTKIMTPMVAVAAGAEVVILYTEAALDHRLISTMDDVADRLARGRPDRLLPR